MNFQLIFTSCLYLVHVNKMTIRIQTGYMGISIYMLILFAYFYTAILSTVHFMQGGICGYYSQNNVQSYNHSGFLVDDADKLSTCL